MESAVANSVTSTPRFANPSVSTEATCSHGPYLRGGVRQAIGASMAIFMGIVTEIYCWYGQYRPTSCQCDGFSIMLLNRQPHAGKGVTFSPPCTPRSMPVAPHR